MKPSLTAKLFSSALMLFSTQVLAGGRDGGGGYVLKCSQGEVLLLDIYEMQKRKMTLSLGAPELQPLAKVDIALKRLARLDPALAAHLRNWAQEFEANANIDEFELTPTNDAFPKFLKPGCVPGQMIVQQVPRFAEDKFYHVDQRLWDVSSNDTKAGAILHEVIYRYAIEQGHEDSIDSRYFNGLLISGEIDKLNIQQYMALQKKMKLVEHRGNLPIQINGISYKWNGYQNIEFNDRGEVIEATYDSPAKTKLKNGTEIVAQYLKLKQNGFLIVHPAKESTYQYNGLNLKITYTVFGSVGPGTVFDQEGHLLNTELHGWNSIPTKYGVFQFAGHIEFYANGLVSRGTVLLDKNNISNLKSYPQHKDLTPGVWVVAFGPEGQIALVKKGSFVYPIGMDGLPDLN